MAQTTELTKALDTSSQETTTPEASAATDADQKGNADSASTTNQPDSNEVASTPSCQGTYLYGPWSTAPISFEEALMAQTTELTKALDTSREESTTPAASAITDTDQPDETASASTTNQPDSHEETAGTNSEEMHMETSTPPETAQAQEDAPDATVEYLPATNDEGSRQAQVTKPEKKAASRAIRNDLARLPSLRFAPCAEVNTGKCLDESLVKRVLGI